MRPGGGVDGRGVEMGCCGGENIVGCDLGVEIGCCGGEVIILPDIGVFSLPKPLGEVSLSVHPLLHHPKYTLKATRAIIPIVLTSLLGSLKT